MGTRIVQQQECDRCGELVESTITADDTIAPDVPDGWGDLHDENGAGFSVCGTCVDAFHRWFMEPDGKRMCPGCQKWFIRLEGHISKMHPADEIGAARAAAGD